MATTPALITSCELPKTALTHERTGPRARILDDLRAVNILVGPNN
jgi:hypothetical protein